MAKVKSKQQKEYVVIYESQEHWEVLGFVKADSLKKAKTRAQKDLLEEAKCYKVDGAEIAELGNPDQISFG